MSTRAIITLACNLPPWFEAIVLPRLEHYAKRCEAELVVIRPERWSGMMTRAVTANAVMQHDRCLVLDADVIVSREAPSIFAAHPPGKVYMASDSHPDDPDAVRQLSLITYAQAVLGPLRWASGFGNAGVVLCDWNACALWQEWFPFPAWTCPDQLNINVRARQLKRPIATLDRCWNSFGLNCDALDPEGRNVLDGVPKICEGAHIAHAAGFKDDEQETAIRQMDQILP